MSERTHAQRGPQYWRSLAELPVRGESPEFAPDVDRAPELHRRNFMQLLGASMALAGAAACRVGPIGADAVPYVEQPLAIEPGEDVPYATALEFDGFARGIVSRNRDGRPVKLEGNLSHPSNLGASSPLEQAALLDLYQPARLREVKARASSGGWPAFCRDVRSRLAASRGEGVELLMTPTSSPTVARLLSRLRESYPGIGVTFYSRWTPVETWTALRLLGNQPASPIYDLERARVIACFGADPLGEGPFHVRYARQFASGRAVTSSTSTMNRLYVTDVVLTETAIAADHHLPASTTGVQRLLALLVREVAALVGAWPSLVAEAGAPEVPAREVDWVRALARDLVAHRGLSMVIPGADLPPSAQALGFALNALLAAPVRYVRPALIDAAVDAPADVPGAAGVPPALTALKSRLDAGSVELLLALGGNPAFMAPRELGLADSLRKARVLASLSLYEDDTAQLARWVLPAAHDLESWGDTRALDGTATIMQPLVRRLHDGRSVLDVLACLAGSEVAGDVLGQARAEVRTTWSLDDTAWRNALSTGVVPNTRHAAILVDPAPEDVLRAYRATLATSARMKSEGSQALELHVRRDGRVHGGVGANNPWLLELPSPVSKLTWGNAALMSPRDAAGLGVRDGDVLRLSDGEREVEIPALIEPGHAPGCLTVAPGYGQDLVGPGRDVGVDIGPLWRCSSVAVRATKTGARVQLARTQSHHELHGRPLVLSTTLEAYRHGENPARELMHPLASFHTQDPWDPAEQWGMGVDLTVCTGCSGCVVACMAENNVPVVGRQGVIKSREMHWLRIDTYFDGPPENPQVLTEPMLCQHCEKAPCEYVCPTYATQHSPDGLNEMVYNRCIGTRFCSNNCPYKVRRFNWFDYNRDIEGVERLRLNPEVTVRARGVMEKCTFCVQRIRRHGIAKRIGAEPTEPLQVACQQACPTNAISFGNLLDRTSEAARRFHSDRAFAVLHETGSTPRIHYLVRLRNQNPELT